MSQKTRLRTHSADRLCSNRTALISIFVYTVHLPKKHLSVFCHCTEMAVTIKTWSEITKTNFLMTAHITIQLSTFISLLTT